MNYLIKTSTNFNRSFPKVTKGNRRLQNAVYKTLRRMKIDPFSRSLKTHKVKSKKYGDKYSSRVTGDIRIIWEFSDDKLVIIAIALGGHSGGRGVY